MTSKLMRDLLIRVDIPDPHEFATAYVEHVETRKADRGTPMPVEVAVQRWLAYRSI